MSINFTCVVFVGFTHRVLAGHAFFQELVFERTQDIIGSVPTLQFVIFGDGNGYDQRADSKSTRTSDIVLDQFIYRLRLIGRDGKKKEFLSKPT